MGCHYKELDSIDSEKKMKETKMKILQVGSIYRFQIDLTDKRFGFFV